MSANIIQAEFFYGDYTAPDLNGFFYSLSNRLAGSIPVKTVVRLYDQDDLLTQLVRAHEEADKQKEHALQREFFAHGLRRMYWRYVRRRRVRELERYESILFAQTVVCLREANNRGLLLATETQDHHFRSIRDDERHELLESVQVASGVCVFVFEPNSLFADKNTVVASAM